MLKYRGSNLIRTGILGVVLVLLVIAVGLQPERIESWATAIRHQAVFAEAGGLTTGNPVKISGVKVGTVSDVRLQGGRAVVSFSLDGKVRLGSQTTAHIRTNTLLGERMLTLEPNGSDRMGAPLSNAARLWQNSLTN